MNFGSDMTKYLAAVLALMMISACAATPQSREDELRLRAQARWEALLENDFVTAHSYMSPGYRSTISAVDLEIEIRSRRVQYQSAEYQSQSCNENACTVTISIGFKVIEPIRGLPEWESTSAVEEQWVRTDGEWWYLPN